MTGISVLVMTLNEQQDLPGCLESLSWCDDIHVFDSLSTDGTLAIARRHRAHIVQRRFDDESTHKNWGLDHIRFKHPWVFCIDADERVTPELSVEMREAVLRNKGTESDPVAYRMPRRDHLMDRWLRHVVPSALYIRLFRPAKVRYERLINPIVVVDGPIGDLDAHFNHFPFSKGMTHWFAKHNRYSSLEGEQTLLNRRKNVSFSIWKAFTESDFSRRRYHQKELFYRLPMRPLVMFLYLYLIKRGFLDGRAGLMFALLRMTYEYMIVLKTNELETQERALRQRQPAASSNTVAESTGLDGQAAAKRS